MLTGKGMYLWKIPYCDGGAAETIARSARAAGFSHVLIKIANGTASFNTDPIAGVDWVKPVAEACRAAGIAVWGWQYVYGYNPQIEAEMALRRIGQVPLDGFVVDAEQEYKMTGATPAGVYLRVLRDGCPLPIALSTYRYPSLHPEFPWEAFLSKVDLVMPQVYWMGATNAADQLARCHQEYRRLAPGLPFVPTGAAFHQDGWTAKPAEIQAFAGQAVQLALPAINFWEWYSARTYSLWDAVAALPDGRPADPPDGKEPAVLRMRVNVDVLNIRSGPGTNYPDVGDLHKGDLVDVLDVAGSNAWVKIGSNPDRWACVQLGTRYMTVEERQ